ncbi:MAG: RluA family pseudouridine synthase [Chloroflexi bacterium]|nr:RluA family pseudouridine synthase [Chloroflexota bacterium]
MQRVTLQVKEPLQRLDRYLAEHFPELSRATIQRLIKEEHVRVNGKPTKASYFPVLGDLVEVEIPAPPSTEPTPEELPLQIVYEDEDLLVLIKPPGMVVHPAPGHASGTLVNALLAHRPDIVRADLDPARPGIVHRLDRDTSGLLVVAANREVQSKLQKLFKSRQVDKVYLALLYGDLSPDQAAIEAPIGRDPVQRKRMAVVAEGGRYARTEYRVRERLPGATLVEAHLLTGRTHQLRVHFASIGHPVVGDATYGHRRQAIDAPRKLLHAWRLSFAHPTTGEQLTFTADMPQDMADVIQRLRA